MKVATHLSKHPKIEWVRYPGLSRDPMHRLQKTYLKGKGGPLVVIGLKGGRAAGEKMINSLKLFSHVANVGDAKSLAIHPASTTHSQLSDEEQEKLEQTCQDALQWTEHNAELEKSHYAAKQKECEAALKPIMTKMYAMKADAKGKQAKGKAGGRRR